MAKRGLAKFNSSWSKLTESSNRPRSRMIVEPQELFRFLDTPSIKVTDLFAADQVVLVIWKYAKEDSTFRSCV